MGAAGKAKGQGTRGARRGMFYIFAALALAGLLAGCASTAAQGEPKLRVLDAWARPTVVSSAATGGAPVSGQGVASQAASSSAVYLTIVNDGDAPDSLVGARSAAASDVELHESVREGDFVRMRPASRIAVPAKGKVAVTPGGLHIMLVGLKQELAPGSTVPLTLRFERSGQVSLEVPVQAER